MQVKILAAGGGSGGHVTPVAAVIQELKKHDPSLEAMFLCDKAFEVQSRGIMEPVGVTVRVIRAGKFRRYAHLTFWQHFTVPKVVTSNFRDVFKVGRGFFQSISIIRRFKPDVVFTKGGFVCLPVGLAAHILRIPLVIHDSDTRPGLTNKFLGKWADAIATGSPLENYHYAADRATYVGVPIADTFRPKTDEQQASYKQKFGFDPHKLLVVAVGGGLGAHSINRAMSRAGQSLLEANLSVYLVAGKGGYEEALNEAPTDDRFKVTPFVYEDMDELLGAADIVVSRGSATFLQELAGLKKAVIIVPAHQLGDQIKNATVFEAAHAAVVVGNVGIEDDSRLSDAIISLAHDETQRNELAVALHSFAKPDAAKDLAQILVTAAKR